jgi:Na+-transporting NADH:ubiquinone oxidoreductase subunit A
VSGLVPTRHTSLVCGSLLAGRSAVSPFEHLGRFHRQVTVLPKEGSNLAARRLLPGAGSLLRLHPGHARPLAGGMLPHDGLDRRWGHEMPPAPLLRALMTGDHERAIALGCLDLGEEDLALASLTCPGGHDYGAYLREALDAIHGQKGG